jgi:hypothetical protein
VKKKKRRKKVVVMRKAGIEKLPYTIYLPVPLVRELRRLREREGLRSSWLVEIALTEFFQQEDWKKKLMREGEVRNWCLPTPG